LLTGNPGKLLAAHAQFAMAAETGPVVIALALGRQGRVCSGFVDHRLVRIENRDADLFIDAEGAHDAFHELVLAAPFGELTHLIEQVGGILTRQIRGVGTGAVAPFAMTVRTDGGSLATNLVTGLELAGFGFDGLQAAVQVDR